jgi:small-conductance mechanosensitive channel
MTSTQAFTYDRTTVAIISIGIAIIIIVILGALTSKNRNFKALHRRYLAQLLQLVLIAYCIVRIVGIFNPGINIHSIFITGSAIIVAIVGFAAQTAISDILCGFLISIFKPFEKGDRIIIEGMEAGVVEDITLRHIVVSIYDDLKIIVPNSQLNTKTLINTSYHILDRRGIHLKFSVSYDTDVHKAMDLIRDCVAESPYTLGVERNGIHEDSGPVYFLEFGASALILETTIWVTKDTSSYVATTDINLRVNKAFKDNNIEIPYNYMNVITSEKEEKITEDNKPALTTPAKKSPSKRFYRTNNVRLSNVEKDMGKVKKIAGVFSQRQNLSPKNARQLELIAEETILLIHSLIGDTPSRLWIEGSGLSYRTHLTFDAEIGSEEYKRLIGLSSSGKNDAISGVAGRIFEAMILGLNTFKTDKTDYEWKMDKDNLSQDEISESILASLSDEIKVSVTKEYVELTVENHKTDKL